MEFASEGDLFQKVRKHSTANTHFTEKEIWHYFIQVVRGLKTLHDMKILHRDIKAANIYIASDNVVKLGDMNVSKIIKAGLAYTQTGTPYYASPEVWRDLPYDYKSDIWSLGCVLYEMCALKPPFMADSMKGLYRKIAKGEYPSIPVKYSDELITMIKMLLQINPTARPTCDQILETAGVKVHLGETLQKLEPPKDEPIGELINTIKVPNNLKVLNLNLPKPKYEERRSRVIHLTHNSYSVNSRRRSLDRLSTVDTTSTEESKNPVATPVQILKPKKVHIEANKRLPLPLHKGPHKKLPIQSKAQPPQNIPKG